MFSPETRNRQLITGWGHFLAFFLVADCCVTTEVAVTEATISSEVGRGRTGVNTGLVETALIWLAYLIVITSTASSRYSVIIT